MKKLIWFGVWSAILIGIIWFVFYNYFINTSSQEHQNTETSTWTWNTKIIKNELLNINIDNSVSTNSWEIDKEVLDKNEKMEVLRKRFSLRGTIARWDTYVTDNQPILALNEYLKALRQSPNDEQLKRKLAWVYFELKRFTNARSTYKEVLWFLTEEEKEKYILSILYTINLQSWNEIQQASVDIRNLSLSKEETLYYINSINCTIDIHTCKKNFDTFFSANPNITFPKLLSMKEALSNYENFQIDNLYYKDALMIGSFYKEKMYSISNVLSVILLQEKTDYLPILLVAGKWYYELWDLWNAKKYLEKYYSLDPKELNITYMLWDINFRLKDYLTSNLYFNSALKNGFEPRIELQRKLAYNYYLSGDKRSMLNVFWYLIEEKWATIDDYSLWIYHAILEWRISNAQSRAESGLKKFDWIQWHEIFYGYLWWIARENNNSTQAETFLKKWLSINGRNPLITLNLWYLEESKKEFTLALMYFKKTVSLNGDGEFWELAKSEISHIETYQKAIQKQ